MARMSSSCRYCGEPIPVGKLQCPGCRKWTAEVCHDDTETVLLSKIPRVEQERLISGPWDFAFGGGLYQTTTVLVGGSPGAGKTTLLLQWAGAVEGEPLYIAAEQSLPELAVTCDRLGIRKEIRFVPALNGVNIAGILHRYKPSLVIIDSLQGLVGKDDLAQCDVCKIAKIHAVRLGCPVIIVSHITKDEMLAGTMTLQHEVDVTAMLFLDEGTRILTTFKSRICQAALEAVFLMTPTGLKHLTNRTPTDESEN